MHKGIFKKFFKILEPLEALWKESVPEHKAQQVDTRSWDTTGEQITTMQLSSHIWTVLPPGLFQ